MSQPIACTLFSSSKGNCTYVKNGGEEFLIDAGVSLRSLECALSALGTSPKNLRCIFITHEHSDHIKGVMNAMKKYGICAVYVAPGNDKLRPCGGGHNPV